jgi:hypothetical protein
MTEIYFLTVLEAGNSKMKKPPEFMSGRAFPFAVCSHVYVYV